MLSSAISAVMNVINKTVKRMLSVASPHMRSLGYEVLELGDGRCLARIPYNEELIGDPITGVLHGGVVTTLLDGAAGVSVLSRIKRPIPLATLDLRIDYLRPSTPGEAILARVECYKTTRNVAFVRGVAFNGDEADPVASMAGTFMLRTTVLRPGKGA